MNKTAIVVHSGGMDSSLCLALACREFGNASILSLSFSYQQRHSQELIQSKKICEDWKIDHTVLHIDCLREITKTSLIDSSIPIDHKQLNTLVIGRNGLMAHLAGIHAHHLGARCIYMGVMELEEANSGYRDCSRKYMDLKQEILRIDLDDPSFEIRTPLIYMTKKQTLEKAAELGLFDYLLRQTITCYEGLGGYGCQRCPACILRNEGIKEFLLDHPRYSIPY